jgi:metal-responsive CopG/Arc/MetJ family transcriptional regulator
MQNAIKKEPTQSVVTLRLSEGLMAKVEEITTERFLTKSEYIRGLIRRDVLDRQSGASTGEVKP